MCKGPIDETRSRQQSQGSVFGHVVGINPPAARRNLGEPTPQELAQMAENVRDGLNRLVTEADSALRGESLTFGMSPRLSRPRSGADRRPISSLRLVGLPLRRVQEGQSHRPLD